jgi:hypothetical protein
MTSDEALNLIEHATLILKDPKSTSDDFKLLATEFSETLKLAVDAITAYQLAITNLGYGPEYDDMKHSGYKN